MIIDFHTHIFPPQMSEDRDKYIERDSLFAELYSNEKASLATAEELIESMDRNSVDISVILNSSWISFELCVEMNDYILESVSRYPERLVGFCAIPSDLNEKTLNEVERCIKGGAKGIGELRPDARVLNNNDESFSQAFINTIRENNLILLLHASEPVGHRYPGKGTITPEILYPFITAYPDITVVCAHWGGGLPFYSLMPEVEKALKNTYFDTAASPFLYSPRIYSQVSHLVGAEKILFGSDYPLLSQERLIKEIRTSDLSEDEKGLVLSGNARKLLNI